MRIADAFTSSPAGQKEFPKQIAHSMFVDGLRQSKGPNT
jgi:hypothetical protein